MANEIFIPTGNTFLYDPYDTDFDLLIKIESFYIDQSPVTYFEFREFLTITGRPFSLSCWRQVGLFNKEYRPQSGNLSDAITCVTWDEATAYAKWKGRRLPTWIELLRAARGYNEQRQPTYDYIRENSARVFAPIQFQNIIEWTSRVGLNYIDRHLDDMPVFGPGPFTDHDPKSLEERKTVRNMMTFLSPKIPFGRVGFRSARNV